MLNTLQQDDMYRVLQYVWAGVLLPTSPSTFQARLDISQDTMQELSAVLENLIGQYRVTQGHCQPFKDDVYPSIVKIADAIYSYAQDAGGTVQTSYYANLFAAVRSLGTTTDPDQVKKIKGNITSLINSQVGSIKQIQEEAASVLAAIKAFSEFTVTDSTNLQSCHTAVYTTLQSKVGDLATLKSDLQTNRTLLATEQSEYLHDKIVACTTLTYAWIPLVGIIAASIVAGIFGSAAAKMAKAIDSTESDITTEEGKITDETRLIADMTSIDHMPDGHAGDLGRHRRGPITSLQNMVDQDIRTAVGFMATLEDAKLVEKWNDLATAVDKYRNAAFISPIEQQSLDELSAQLHKQATESGPNKCIVLPHSRYVLSRLRPDLSPATV
ncbi:hypothetical protein GGG16DRAFT_109699 [Schizophyllum commune]